MKKVSAIKKRYGIPRHVNIKVIDYSRLPDRKILQRIKKIESSLRGKDESFEDASIINELNVLEQEVQRRKLQVSA